MLRAIAVYYFQIDFLYFHDRALFLFPVNPLEYHRDGEDLAFGESQPVRLMIKPLSLEFLCK